VFSDLRCTRETAAAALELTLSCSVKSIDDQVFMNFVRRRMMSSMHGNGRPIKLSYATRSPRLHGENGLILSIGDDSE